MDSVPQLLAHRYRSRLRAAGIPSQPDDRTPDQQDLARWEFWAAQTEVLLDAGSLAQAAVEGR